MSTMICIDGSRGEGGGQIVRSALALALVTGRPVTIDSIRAGRQKPGLLLQHLAAVNAAVDISGGTARGAALGSRCVSFEPVATRPGECHFRVGSAGSATLVVQTVLPALMLANGPSTLIVEGGTHNPWAPPFDFLARAFVPLVNRMGPRITIQLDRHGFFPAGGGRLRVQIEPAEALAGFDLCERGEIVDCRARVLLSNLPAHIARREIDTIVEKTGWKRGLCSIEEVPAAGPGNVVILEIVSANVTDVFTAFGRRGVKAERVATDAAHQALEYIKSGAPVGPYLADQLLLPLGISAWQGSVADAASVGAQTVSEPVLPSAIGRGEKRGQRGGSFRTLPLSGHSATHIDLLREFLGISIQVESSANDRTCIVRIK
jgi:RNA 3'-terminal phosphate cyclase (ATP)